MKRIIMIAALTCSVAVAGPAVAQQEESIYDQNYAYGSYETVTSGSIDSFRVVDLQGFEDEHVVVRVQPRTTGAGYEFAFVHLGPRSHLRNRGIQIAADQNITARGQMGRISGRPVLFAERVVLDGREYALGPVERTSRDAQQFQQRQSDPWPDLERQQGQQQFQELDPAYDQQRTRDYDRVWPYEEDTRPFAGDGDYPRDYYQAYDEEDFAARTGRQPGPRPFSGATDPARNYEYGSDWRSDVTQRDRGMSQRSASGAGTTYVIRGQVESVRDFDIQGVAESHRLIKVTDTTGQFDQTYVIDLGPTSGPMADLNLERGDQVRIEGQPARIEGRSVLQAHQIAEVYSRESGALAYERKPSARLRRDSPEPSDSPSRRVGKPEVHDQPSRTSSDLSDW